MNASDRWYIHTEFYPPDICAESDVWSVTKVDGEPGWNTNGGEIGSGLTKADAQFLADAANEKIEREAVLAETERHLKAITAFSNFLQQHPDMITDTGKVMARLRELRDQEGPDSYVADLVNYGNVGWLSSYGSAEGFAPGEDPNSYRDRYFVMRRPWVKL